MRFVVNSEVCGFNVCHTCTRYTVVGVLHCSVTFKGINNAGLSEAIDDYTFWLLREGVQCSDEPASTLRLQNRCTCVNLHL